MKNHWYKLLSALARKRLEELAEETQELQTFLKGNAPKKSNHKSSKRKRAKGPSMSAEARAIISKRQKVYWKRWRKEHPKKTAD